MIYFAKIPQFSKREEGLLNSDALGEQFGRADVCDGSAISLNRNRTPRSRVRTDKISLEKEKRQAGKAKER